MPKRTGESLKWLSGIWVKKKKKKVVLLKKTRQGRLNAWQKLTKKMEDDMESHYISKLDEVFARFIRRRDRRNDCITNKVKTCSHKIENCCHFIPRWRYSHRREERNCSGGCVSCNKYHQQDHWQEYMLVMVEKHGAWFIREQMFKRHKIKPSVERLKEKILYYTNLINGQTTKEL